ncbi:MAG TPA: ABC transporter ATP-binding protein, partial [Arenicellales bacterium]|nr:ABC transporter ATP-binding protein [Arenicellales bacterium]
IGELQRAAGSAARLFELLQTRPAFARPPELAGEFPEPVAGHIAIEGLSFSYPGRSNTPALTDISLHIHAGETLALVGPSGAGKSTLFDLLMHFYQPDSGHIHIDHTDTATVSLSALRSCFSLVPQNPALFHGADTTWGRDWVLGVGIRLRATPM